MKRMRTTMIALAVSGSLIAGAAPAAMAQATGTDVLRCDIDPYTHYFKHSSGEWVETAERAADETRLTEDELAKSEEAKALLVAHYNNIKAFGNGSVTPGCGDWEDNTMPVADEAFSRVQTDFNAYTLAGPNQPTFYRHHCGVWVDDQNRIGSDVALTQADLARSEEIKALIRADIENRVGFGSDPMAGASNVPDPSPAGAPIECTMVDESTPGSSDGFDARKLGFILPATLAIGGIIWYLSQDGKTYVKDQARVTAQPTDEEKKASEQMLKDNAEEVKRQAGAKDVATTGQRGMLAQTGSNEVAKALAAIAMLSVIGAAAFVARRKALI